MAKSDSLRAFPQLAWFTLLWRAIEGVVTNSAGSRGLAVVGAAQLAYQRAVAVVQVGA